MRKYSIEELFEKYRYIIFFTITGFLALSTSITNPILDSNFLFHEGEYVGLLYHMRAFYSGEIQFPMLIHGGMDYLPSMVASSIYGDSHIIVGTRAINTIIVWLCWVLFFDLCYSVISKKPNQHIIWMIVAIMIFFAITPRFNAFALLIQHSFLGPRDIFVVASVWCFTKFMEAIPLIRQRLFLIAGTCSAVIAIFWSYDRGIIALAFLFVMLMTAIKNKEKVNFLLFIFSTLLSLIFIQYSNIFGSLVDNANNVFYWVKNSKEVFGIGFLEVGRVSLIIITLLILFCVGTIVLVLKSWSDKTDKHKVIIIGLIFIQILLLKTILNRPGMPRLIWAIWPSILMALHYASREFTINFQVRIGSLVVLPNLNRVHKYYLISFLFLVFIVTPWLNWYGSFVKNIVRPKLDSQIVSSEVISLGKTISQYDDKCFFGWINEGVIALIAKKRFCTQYPYATYVSKVEEQKLLQQIKMESPNAIVFNINGDSMMNIDNRSMSSRLPKVQKFILDNYPNRQQVGRYLVVSK